MKNNNESIVRVLKFSISVFSILSIINFIGIANTSYALFEKSVDSKNSLSIKVASQLYAKPGIATNVITNLSKKDTTNLAYDETVDNNLRYIGKDPNNYVLFNNELWRIIGVMNNIDDGTGKKETRIKLIRNETIGNYSWNSSDSNTNSGFGLNEWSQADLMKLLNPGYESEAVGGSLYWNRKSGTCYNGVNNKTSPCNFIDTGLLNNSKKMIEKAIWYLGTLDTSISDDNNGVSWTANNLYLKEKGEKNGKQCYTSHVCNDNIIRTKNWTGKIGLMYPSDFGFATSDSECYKKSMSDNWNPCYEKDWIYKSNVFLWTITPFANSSHSTRAFYARTFLSHDDTQATKDIYPSLYLKPEVKITSGYGTKDRPYQIDL